MRPILLVCAILLPSLSLAAPCAQPPVLTPDGSNWTGWGNGHANTRQATDGITRQDLASLELRWAFGFPDTGSVVGNPVVQNDVLFIGVDNGAVYALDANSGCEHWAVQSPSGGVRTAPALAQLDGRWLLFFGSRGADVFAVDALNGNLVWRTKVDEHPAAILTGSPQFVMLEGETPAARLLVPVSSSEEGMAAVPTYACCSFRGSVVSLDAASGEPLWKTHVIQASPATTGDKRQGPSGAGIWSAPTINVASGQVFVTTGDAYSAPADIATDAVVALDLIDGRIQWINQGTADDIWTVACMRPSAPADCGPDQDYGSPAMLVSVDGATYLVAGQKSGIVRAFDLAGGATRWQTALVANTTEFGGKIIWGGASDGTHAYFGLGPGGIHAVRMRDGARQWFTPLAPAPDRETHAGQDGPLTVSADLVLSSGWDGVLRALATESGALLWEFDTMRDFTTVNGVQAKGGSMGAAGPVVAGRRLFVPSGYVGVKNGVSGNVLLMFAPSSP